MSQSIPDLRAHQNDFTLEHCSVLQERLGKFLDVTFGPGHSEIASQIDTEAMQEDLLSLMRASQLCTLFEDELGKGILVGLFYARFIDTLELGED